MNFLITIQSFDFDNSALAYSSFLTPYTRLNSSGDGTWGSSVFALKKYEAGEDVEITIGPNNSIRIENDLCFSVNDNQDRIVPLIYPPEVYSQERIPNLKSEVK